MVVKRLEMGFERLQEHILKLGPKKWHFLRRSVHFLGHVIECNHVSTEGGGVVRWAGPAPGRAR